MSHIIAVLNQKGGVGKTTTAINLGAYLAKAGKSVLIVDFDPQGNATGGLGFDKRAIEPSMYEVLLGQAEVDQAIKPTSTKGLRILPANPRLAAAEVEMVSIMSRETLLKRALQLVDADVILIDCPPSLGLLTINALTAADGVLVPVQAEYYALEGLGQLVEVIQQVRDGLNANLELLGIVVTMHDARTSLSDQVHDQLKQHFGAKVFTTVIPRNVRLAEAPSHGKTIADHDKWSKGARAYKQLSKEFLAHVSKT